MPASGDRLKTYRTKRHFDATPEPAGAEVETETPGGGRPVWWS